VEVDVEVEVDLWNNEKSSDIDSQSPL